ncbi:MAG: WG repeat-containing protein [Saprospiraceae bacterium]|nr:WG repeat-containing protein [Saprospiraceae bacterium]
MKNGIYYTLFSILLLLCTDFDGLTAQNLTEKATPKSETTEELIVTAKSIKPADAMEEARRRFKMLFNIYRDFTITIDTLALSTVVDMTKKDEETVKSDFGTYLDKMNATLTKKVEKITSNTKETQKERSRYLAGLNTLKSARCLQVDKTTQNFAQTRDMDNNLLMAFDLEALRHSSRYGQVENYREGFARIRKDQVYGFLNLCGEEVVTCQYERAEPFNLGKALVKRVDWFLVDAEGNETEPLENVADAKALRQGISWVRMTNNKEALIDNNYATTKVSLSQYYDAIDSFYNKEVFKVRNGKKIGLIGLDGKTIFDAIYDNIEPTNLSGVYRIYQNKTVGLLDTTWAIRVSPTYESISDFNEFGIATVKDRRGLAYTRTNTYKMSKFYLSISDFNEFGVSSMRNEGNLYGLIDTNLNVVVLPKYGSIGNFNDLGLASACYPDGKCGFIKYDGKEQIKANYESVGSFNKHGLAVAQTRVEDCDGKNGSCTVDVIIDRNGNTVVPVSDEAIKKKWRYKATDSLHVDRFIIVKVINNESKNISSFLLIHKTNLQLITSVPYNSISPIDILGNLRVESNNKWGMIDSTGKLLAKPIYQEIKRFNDSYYPAQNDKGKWGFLNKKGKPQIAFEYEDVRNFRFGLAPVSQGKGKWGLINRFNAKIVPCNFRSVQLNEAETKFHIKDENDTVFIINENGECETNCSLFEKLRAAANKAN